MLEMSQFGDTVMIMSRASILIVDDDSTYASKLKGVLEGLFVVDVCHSEDEATKRLHANCYGLIILDVKLAAGREGLNVLRLALELDPLQAAIVMTAYSDMETYAEAIEAGAMTYLDKKEFSPSLIGRTVESIVEQSRLKRRLSALEQRIESAEPLEIIGASAAMRRVREELREAAASDTAVVLVGEPGTGKELSARNIHRLNPARNAGPFLRMAGDRGHGENFAQRLLGAKSASFQRKLSAPSGVLKAARGGVLLLGGLAWIDDKMWPALVDLAKSGVCKSPVDGGRIEADIQIILASDSRSIGRTREFVRNTGATVIKLPPLREHVEDITLLAQYTLQRLYRAGGTRVRSFRGAALSVLDELSWPGNVRELQCAVTYAAIRADAADELEIGTEHLPATPSGFAKLSSSGDHIIDYLQELARAELALTEKALAEVGPSTRADLAQRLGYNDRYVFSRRLRKCLKAYPALRAQFPKVSGFMTSKRRSDERVERNRD